MTPNTSKFFILTRRKWYNNQPLKLANICNNLGSILHELNHAVGFYHEHNRSDRDQFLNVLEEYMCIILCTNNMAPLTALQSLVDNRQCSSIVGKWYDNQPLKLANICNNLGSILHELNHAVGFYHEHNRSDRDQFLNVLEENIRFGQEHNFRKFRPEEEKLIGTFDPDSIMLYGHKYFAKHPALYTIETLDGTELRDPDYKTLSVGDIMKINTLYNCTV
ncbi:hypothetical protein LAZ67_4000981 [Cordylochernes scorpioides]|uniref:Metalloendopeptidase n=1 Tax=Cordylochernes scorpioides TaxID=51811 RepID=A0ABY6KCW8_9ARAC|nr:hypothetical protein LAZ67_4000981 [Cordylochernes scorpioides]